QILILKEYEKAGDNVGYQALRAQPASQTEDAGSSQDGFRVNLQGTEHDDSGAKIKSILADRLKQWDQSLISLIDGAIFFVGPEYLMKQHGHQLDQDAR